MIDVKLHKISHCDHCGMNTTTVVVTPLYGAEVTIDGKTGLVCEFCIKGWVQKFNDMGKK